MHKKFLFLSFLFVISGIGAMEPICPPAPKKSKVTLNRHALVPASATLYDQVGRKVNTIYGEAHRGKNFTLQAQMLRQVATAPPEVISHLIHTKKPHPQHKRLEKEFTSPHSNIAYAEVWGNWIELNEDRSPRKKLTF